MMRKYCATALAFLFVSILLELTVFNCKALLSLSASNQHLGFVRYGDTVYADDMSGEPHYLYIGISSYTESGEQVPVGITIFLQDEGNAGYYELPQVTIYPPIEKDKYLAVYSYGAVQGMRIELQAYQEADVQVTDIIYDVRVPWFVTIPRIFAVFGVLCLVSVLRPGSGIYARSWGERQKRIAAGVLILANSIFFLFLVRSNPAFFDPVWPYHQQYHQLAVALSQGKVSIDAGSGEILASLAAMDNPYDYGLRAETVPYYNQVWDICYYQGNFYVYFGIVPVLVFYLPYYLLFHSAFPTWFGVFLAGVGIIGGVYYLMAKICRKWFPGIPYMYYLLISLLAGNSLNLFCAMLHADFYVLPILMALCFAIWGLGLLFSALECWDQERKRVGVRLACGGLCLALTAGCRPQFLVGSFLMLPILLPLFWQNRKSKQTWARFAALALPYIVVAAGIMYYNGIRFGSVFDFGANYNLTTNDMTRRGFNLGRLPDGIFMYLFQPISLKLGFPFAEVTAFYSDYLGSTIRDWTYGGAFWVRPILLGLICFACVKKDLRRKKAFGFTVAGLCMALAVVVADTEMSGILNRYYTDFLWLFIIPAAVILFQMLEKYQDAPCLKWIVCFILCAGAWGIFYELGTAFRGSGIMNDNVHKYYLIRSFFR